MVKNRYKNLFIKDYICIVLMFRPASSPHFFILPNRHSAQGVSQVDGDGDAG